jgi:TP901 family phage tail tape measure protein
MGFLSRGVRRAINSLLPLIGVFAAIQATLFGVQSVVNFEEAMAQVRGIAIRTNETLSTTVDQFEELKSVAESLGATTRFTATQVAEGQLFLARAGFTVQEILDALPGTLDVAAAGMLDLGRAADIASNVLQEFRLEAEEMNRVGDVLVNTANRSNTDILQMAEALKLAGPVAGALRIDLEDTAAAIGVLGNAGIQASLAGTQLRGIMATLSAPTRQARDALDAIGERLGVTADFFDLTKESADGVTPALFRILRGFKDAGTTASEFFQIFQRRQAAGGIILSEFIDQVEALAESNKKADGEARRLAAIVEDTLAGAVRALKSAFEALFITIGESGGLTAARSFIEFLTGTLRLLAGVRVAGSEATVTMQLFAFAIRAAVIAFAAWIALKPVAFLGTLIASFAAAARTAAGFVAILGAVRGALISTGIGGIAVLIGALVGGFLSLTSSARSAAAEMRNLNDEAKAFAPLLEQISAAQARQRVAQRDNNRSAEVQAIKEEIDALGALRVKVEELAGASGGKVAIELSQIGPEAVADVVAQIERVLTRATSRGRVAGEELGETLAIGLIEGFGKSDQLDAFEDVMRDALQRGVAVFEDIPGFEQSLAVIEEQLERVRTATTNEISTEAYKELRIELEKLAGSFAFRADPNDVLAAVEARMKAIENSATNLQEKFGDGIKVFSDEELEAQDELSAVEKRLLLETELVQLTREEADIRRQLEDLKSLAASTGLAPEEVQARIEVIETLLREVKALEAARDAQQRATDARKRASEDLAEYVAEVTREREAVTLTANELAVLEARTKALSLATAAGVEDVDAVVAAVVAEIEERQRLEAAIDSNASALERLSTARNEAIADAERLEQELESLQSVLTAEERSLVGTPEVERALDAVRSFGAETDALIATLGRQVTQQLAVAQSTAEGRAAIEEYEAAVARAREVERDFADTAFGLVAVAALRELRDEVRGLDDEMTSLFRSDRENRTAADIEGINRVAQNLFGVLEGKRELGLIDQEEFVEGARALERLTARARDFAVSLEKLRTIRRISDDIAEGFGAAVRGVILGTTTAREALDQLLATIRGALVEAIIVDPLKDALKAALTQAGAALAGVEQGVALEAAATAAGASFGVAVQTAASTFVAGVTAAGNGLIIAATQAAAILAQQQAVGAALSLGTAAVGGAAGAVGGAGGAVQGAGLGGSPAIAPLPAAGFSPAPLPVSGGARAAGPVNVGFYVTTKDPDGFRRSRSQMERDARRVGKKLGGLV